MPILPNFKLVKKFEDGVPYWIVYERFLLFFWAETGLYARDLDDAKNLVGMMWKIRYPYLDYDMVRVEEDEILYKVGIDD